MFSLEATLKNNLIIGTTDEGAREVCSMIADILWST